MERLMIRLAGTHRRRWPRGPFREACVLTTRRRRSTAMSNEMFTVRIGQRIHQARPHAAPPRQLQVPLAARLRNSLGGKHHPRDRLALRDPGEARHRAGSQCHCGGRGDTTGDSRLGVVDIQYASVAGIAEHSARRPGFKRPCQTLQSLQLDLLRNARIRALVRYILAIIVRLHSDIRTCGTEYVWRARSTMSRITPTRRSGSSNWIQ